MHRFFFISPHNLETGGHICTQWCTWAFMSSWCSKCLPSVCLFRHSTEVEITECKVWAVWRMVKVSPVVCWEAVARNWEHLGHFPSVDCKAAVNTYYCCKALWYPKKAIVILQVMGLSFFAVRIKHVVSYWNKSLPCCSDYVEKREWWVGGWNEMLQRLRL